MAAEPGGAQGAVRFWRPRVEVFLWPCTGSEGPLADAAGLPLVPSPELSWLIPAVYLSVTAQGGLFRGKHLFFRQKEPESLGCERFLCTISRCNSHFIFRDQGAPSPPVPTAQSDTFVPRQGCSAVRCGQVRRPTSAGLSTPGPWPALLASGTTAVGWLGSAPAPWVWGTSMAMCVMETRFAGGRAYNSSIRPRLEGPTQAPC